MTIEGRYNVGAPCAYEAITNQTFYVHQESKKLLTRTELLILLAEGFEDVSYGNDECASFARPDNAFINGVHYDPIAIYICPNEDEAAEDGKLFPHFDDRYFYLHDYHTGKEWYSEVLEHLIYEYKMIIKQREEDTGAKKI